MAMTTEINGEKGRSITERRNCTDKIVEIMEYVAREMDGVRITVLAAAGQRFYANGFSEPFTQVPGNKFVKVTAVSSKVRVGFDARVDYLSQPEEPFDPYIKRDVILRYENLRSS